MSPLASSRREFLAGMAQVALTYTLMEAVVGRRLLAGPEAAVVDAWAQEIEIRCRDLRTASISPQAWQEVMAALLQRIDIGDLMAAIDFARLTRDFPFPDRGVATRPLALPALRIDGDLAFMAKIFGMRRHRAIIPHGHTNMASAHMILQGTMELRQYDRVRDEPEHLVIRPTRVEEVGPGSVSSISDAANNVHWLRALSKTAFTLDVIVLDLGGRPYGIDNIDPLGGEPLPGGLLRAPRLPVAEALARYG